jgi:hypothetical protein
MSYLDARVLDRGLEVLVRETTRLLIGPAEPTDYGSAMHGALGWVVPSVVGPSNYLPVGRKVIVLEIIYGMVFHDGHAAFWSLVDDREGAVRLLAAGSLGNPLDVAAGNAFTLTAFEIAIPGAQPGTGTPPIIVSGTVGATYRTFVGAVS